MEFLEHTINSDGIKPSDNNHIIGQYSHHRTSSDNIQKSSNFPKRVTTTDLLRFLGMVTYYHRFLPYAAQQLASLHEAANSAKTK